MRWMLLVVLVGCEVLDDSGCPDATEVEVVDDVAGEDATVDADPEDGATGGCLPSDCMARCVLMDDKYAGGACVSTTAGSCACCACARLDSRSGFTVVDDGFGECAACGVVVGGGA